MSSGVSSIRSSPIPDLAYDSYRSLSLRDQTLVKRQMSNAANASHVNYGHGGNGSNLTPTPAPENARTRPPNPHLQHHLMRMSQNPNDYVTVHGDTYALTPYSGETLLFWILLAVLTVLVLANATLTIFIFGSLRIGAGMESIEFLPSSLKFFGETDLDEINKLDGIIEGYGKEPVVISAGEDGGKIRLAINDAQQPTLTLDKTGINVTHVEEFRVVSRNGKPIFSTSTPTLDLPSGVKDLRVRIARVNRITSAINSSLELSSSSFTYLKGSEGTRMEGRDILFSAQRDLLLKSLSGNIKLSGGSGVSVYTPSLAIVSESGVTRNQYTLAIQGKKQPQYKLCICMPQGKLFRVEIPLNNRKNPDRSRRIGCHSAVNPC